MTATSLRGSHPPGGHQREQEHDRQDQETVLEAQRVGLRLDDLAEEMQRAGLMERLRDAPLLQQARDLTEQFAVEAIKFIDANLSRPFFIYLPLESDHE